MNRIVVIKFNWVVRLESDVYQVIERLLNTVSQIEGDIINGSIPLS